MIKATGITRIKKTTQITAGAFFIFRDGVVGKFPRPRPTYGTVTPTTPPHLSKTQALCDGQNELDNYKNCSYDLATTRSLAPFLLSNFNCTKMYCAITIAQEFLAD